MKQQMMITVIVLLLIVICVGCTSKIVMPYSSEEYINGKWSIEELVTHFKELGFEEIEVSGNTTEIKGVYAENADSLFESFEKGTEFDASRKIGIYTDFESIAPISVDNSPEFANFVEDGIDTQEKSDEWLSFLKLHNEEMIEFDGTITDWYDKFWYISGISFTVDVENSEKMSISWDTDNFDELGLPKEYDYNNYYLGLIQEGMSVHILAKIDCTEGVYPLKIHSMQITD